MTSLRRLVMRRLVTRNIQLRSISRRLSGFQRFDSRVTSVEKIPEPLNLRDFQNVGTRAFCITYRQLAIAGRQSPPDSEQSSQE